MYATEVVVNSENLDVNVTENHESSSEDDPFSSDNSMKDPDYASDESSFLRNNGKAYKSLNKGQEVSERKINPPCGDKCIR